MENRTSKLLLATILAITLSETAFAEPLKIFNWKNYYDPELIEQFEDETGIDVQISEFTTIKELEAAFREHADYDIMVPSHFQLPDLIAANQIEKLDTSKLSNYSAIDNTLLAALASFNNAKDYAVPYLWTAVGIAYDAESVKSQLHQDIPQSWSLVFYDDYLKRISNCGVSWVDAPVEMFSLKANFSGRKLDFTSQRRLGIYSRELKKSVSYIKEINNQHYIRGLESGELCASVAWAGHVLNAMKTRSTLKFMLPKEGALLSIDSWVIMKDSSMKAAAYQLINYMLTPRAGRRNAAATNFFSHLPPSAASFEGVGLNPTDVLGDNYRHKLYFIENIDNDRTQLIDSYWQSIKSSM